MQINPTEERLDWFTHDTEPDGQQICAIRPEATKDVARRLVLSRDDSRVLLLLNEIAQDRAIPLADSRQVILCALYRAHGLNSPTR